MTIAKLTAVACMILAATMAQGADSARRIGMPQGVRQLVGGRHRQTRPIESSRHQIIE